jgi:hypothetical protein
VGKVSVLNSNFERGFIVLQRDPGKRVRAFHEELEDQYSEPEEIMFGYPIHVGEFLSL